MKYYKFFYSLLLLSAIYSCVNNDDPLIQCAAIDYAIPGLVIEITDVDGNNLLDNGTYNPDDVAIYNDTNLISRIRVENDETFVYVLLSSSIDNKDVNLILNDTESDVIRINLNRKTTGVPCFFPTFEVDKVFFNGERLEVDRLNFDPKVIVVK